MKDHGLSFGAPSAVTRARDEAATSSNITHWFSHVYTPAMAHEFVVCAVFNADEIHIDFDMKSKVAKVKGGPRSPAVIDETNPGHITMMLTISPGGDAPPPFFIFGALKNVPETITTRFPSNIATFACNDKGWMGRDMFLLWATNFTNWVAEKRRIGAFSPQQRLLLFVDAHTSRDCPPALQLFAQHGVSVITFPGQLTHIMQPVDVSIGAPFRTYFRQLLRKLMMHWKSALPPSESMRKPTAAEKRDMMIAAAIDAAHQATTITNRESGFRATGIVPYDPAAPLRSPYVRRDELHPTHPDGRMPSRPTCAAKILTSS
jgi:hypothetical protein